MQRYNMAVDTSGCQCMTLLQLSVLLSAFCRRRGCMGMRLDLLTKVAAIVLVMHRAEYTICSNQILVYIVLFTQLSKARS